jgi:hypothetical protein
MSGPYGLAFAFIAKRYAFQAGDGDYKDRVPSCNSLRRRYATHELRGHELLGISRNILNDRLTKLVDTGIFERVPYRHNPPLKMRHSGCGRIVKAAATDSHCGEPLGLRSVAYEPGASAPCTTSS